jgi:hypothetical protein
MADLPDKHATARRLIRGCEGVLSKLEQVRGAPGYTECCFLSSVRCRAVERTLNCGKCCLITSLSAVQNVLILRHQTLALYHMPYLRQVNVSRGCFNASKHVVWSQAAPTTANQALAQDLDRRIVELQVRAHFSVSLPLFSLFQTCFTLSHEQVLQY